MSEEKGYEIKDRRKVKLDEEGNVISQPEDEGSKTETAKSEGGQSPNAGEMPPVDIYSLINSFIGILVPQTWQWLGLIKNPVTDKLEIDLQQARVAIDTISLLIGQLEARITPAEYRELQAVISDLRLNYVQQSAKEKDK